MKIYKIENGHRSTGIFTLNTQVNSCCTHTKHTQKEAQLIIVVATTKYYT